MKTAENTTLKLSKTYQETTTTGGLATKSKEEIQEMVKVYQAEPSEYLFTLIHEALFPLAEKVALKYYLNSHSFNNTHHITKDEYSQCASIAIYRALQGYDFEKAKGTYFTTSVKQYVEWVIKDSIFKKNDTNQAKLHGDSLSLDKTFTGEDGKVSMADLLEDQMGTDVDAVFDAVYTELSEDDSLVGVLLDLVNEFSEDASEDDVKIIKMWVATVLDHNGQGSLNKAVNNALATVFPELATASLRKRKSRAEKRFNAFAIKKGYTSFCLSHF